MTTENKQTLTEKLLVELWPTLQEGCPLQTLPVLVCTAGEEGTCKTCWTNALLAIVQPEIDRARVEGRGEVVEWVHNHSIGVTAENEIKNNPLWQSKLKEWGLEAQE